jgi:hypothetical protein
LIKLTIFDVIRAFAGWAFLYLAIPAAIAALAIRFVPAWRRSRRVRVFAYAILGFIAFLGVTGAPMVLYEIDRTLGPLIRRTTLSEPRIVDGIAFPAGTRLQFDKYWQVESGIFPSPTLVQGLLLTGRFEVEHNAFAKPRIWAGVLARESEIEGVPCASEEFQRPDWVSPEILKCRLARDFDFLGYPLASGSLIELYPAYGPKRLERGTLRTSVILFGVEWPAGTAITAERDAATLLHAPVTDYLTRLCVPQGSAIVLKGVESHGAVEIATGGSLIGFWSDPAVIAEQCPNSGMAGYVLQGEKRQTHLELQISR